MYNYYTIFSGLKFSFTKQEPAQPNSLNAKDRDEDAIYV
ncbi:hypothetical protein KCTC52924_02978 [Arenibacter antarcticus]